MELPPGKGVYDPAGPQPGAAQGAGGTATVVPHDAARSAVDARSLDASAREPSDVVARYGDLVYNLAVRLTGDREEARDLAQDALIRIIKGIGSFRGEAAMKTWIVRVVVNCHRNRMRWWRRRRRAATISLDAQEGGAGGPTLGETVADDAPGPEQRARAAQAARRLQRALMDLPREQRTALVLREVEGMSYDQIAAALGVREGTVKSRIARAREALRAALPDLSVEGA